MTIITVLYDDACPLCRSLAALASRRAGEGLRFASWQDFRAGAEAQAALPEEALAQPADRLRVLAEGRLFEGGEAWEHLLQSYKDLAGLNWLAEKTGLRKPVARSIGTAGGIVRRLCRKCKSRFA